LKNYSNHSEDLPQVVERVDRSFNWKLLILAISLIAVIVYWPLLYEFASKQIESSGQAETSQTGEKNEQMLADAEDSSSFDNVLDTALRYDREGKRVLAATLFQELLRQAAQNPGYNEHIAALLPRAADFYSKGDEIPAEQVEILYQDAYHAIKQIHGPDYYDYENVHWGLEKHYLSLGRFEEAALQTSMLLEFYRRYYKDNKDSQYAFIRPTTIRFGDNLLAAGQNVRARQAYQAALKMTRERGQPISAIEERIAKTYQQEEAVPSSMMETPKMPASIAANTPSVTPANSLANSGSDLKKAIEAISMGGIYIEQVLEKDDSLIIIGYADDNKTVASYMRLIQNEVAEPTLNWVKREERQQLTVSGFSIRLPK
jgi:Fimbrial assembly protein (PilN)